MIIRDHTLGLKYNTMKTKSIYHIFISLLLYINVSAQQNLPLNFEEDAIKWSELSWMEGQNSKDQWHLIASPPIIENDTIYLFTNYYQKELESGKNYGYCGYMIKKLNIKTGEKYWETKRKYKEFGNRKIISHVSKVQRSLEIALYEESHAIGINTDWNECYPAYITIETENGEIIDSNYVDKTDIQLPRLRSFGNLYLAGDTRPVIFKTKNGYRHMRSWLDGFLCTNLDNDGRLITVDSVKYPKYKYFIKDLKFEQMPNDSFWVTMVNKGPNWSDIQVLFTKYDSNMKLDTTYDVSRHIIKPYSSAGVYVVEKEYFVLGTDYFDDTNQTWKFHYYTFNTHGKFIDSISYTMNPVRDAPKRYLWLAPIVDKVNKRLLMTQSYQNNVSESTKLEFYIHNGDTIKTLKKLVVEGIKDHFNIDYGFMLDNGDILIYIHQLTPDISPSGDRWYSWILLDGQKMNIISNTQDDYIVKNQLILYPNPTFNMINIQNLNLPANVRISNLSGELITSFDNVTDQIQIEALSSGMYIIDIKNKHISERYKVVKVE